MVLATGIAHPERAARTARALGLEVLEHLAFADHHRFPQRSLDRIERARERTGAETVVVTAKDRVKIEDRLETRSPRSAVTAVLEPAFWSGSARTPEIGDEDR